MSTKKGKAKPRLVESSIEENTWLVLPPAGYRLVVQSEPFRITLVKLFNQEV